MNIKKTVFLLLTSFLVSSTFLLTACDQKSTIAPPKQQVMLPMVNVAVFEASPLDYDIKYALNGRVIASQTAEIRPQVSGIILKKEFTESSYVKKGQSLYQIDDAMYQANYDKAVANYESTQHTAKMAKVTLNRYKDLFAKKAISQQEYDKAVLDEQQAAASELAAKASLISAKVNLDYTKVYSPIDGYIGKSTVTEGALVSSGLAHPMAVVRNIDPIYVDMTQSASIYAQNMRYNSAHSNKQKVELFFEDGTKYNGTGEVIFTDKNVNESTGSMNIRAAFINPNEQILPGMFVKSVVTVGKLKNAILVPQKGITSDAKGNYTAIVAVPVLKAKESEVITKALLAAKRVSYDAKNNSEYEKAANTVKNEVEAIIKRNNNAPFYYFEKRSNIKVHSGISGYFVVTEGINPSDKVVVTGLLNLSSIGMQHPDAKTFANIVAQPGKLTQQELDALVESSIK